MTDVEQVMSELSDLELKTMLTNNKDFAALNGMFVSLMVNYFLGILKLAPDGRIVTLQHTFLPSPFPREQFEKAVGIQKSFNSLFLRVASDYEFLESTFKP